MWRAERLDDEGRERVEQHMDIALRFAGARHKRAPWIDREDLEGAAVYGLCLASSAWKGRCPFEAFAIQVIDIEIGEEVRRWRWGAARALQFDDGAEYLVEALETGWDDGPVRDAFEGLPAVCRHVLDRVVIRGETMRDAARDLGINRAGVYKALKRAKAHLRRMLAPSPAIPA